MESPTDKPESGQRRLTMILGGCLALALLAIAFLVGRLTAPAATAPAITAAIAAPTPVVTPAPLSEPTPSATLVPDFAAPQSPSFTFPSPPDTVPSNATSSESPASGARSAIKAYFAEIERFDDMGGGNPQDVANSMMKSVTSGDYSGFDALVAKAKTQRDHLKAMNPPAACAEHHRLAVSLSQDSVAMLERLRASLKGGDPSGLMSMMTEAREMEARLDQLKTLTASIKTAAGVS